jgi:hypothetical protein
VEDNTTPQQEEFQQQRDQLPEIKPQGIGKKLQRMHTTRARDGRRTQSGGVKDGGERLYPLHFFFLFSVFHFHSVCVSFIFSFWLFQLAILSLLCMGTIL